MQEAFHLHPLDKQALEGLLDNVPWNGLLFLKAAPGKAVVLISQQSRMYLLTGQ